MGIRKECVICKGVFVARTKTHICCSPVCAKTNKDNTWYAKIGKATCTVCNKEYQPKSCIDTKYGRYNKYCSTTCRSKSSEWHKRKGQTLRLIPKGKNKSPVYFNHCKICSCLFTTKSKLNTMCSVLCRAKDYERVKEEQKIKTRERDKAKFIPKGCLCKECNKTFTTSYGNTNREYCSKQCSSRHHKRIGRHSRRARMKGNEYETVNPFKVFNRDKWTCRMCGIKTPRKLRGTIEENAPELDHIIALAQGGSHTYNNVQCSCRKCNYTKGDKIVGQLPMFA